MKKSKFPPRLEVARKMPPLYHHRPGEEFRSEDSEVIEWLIKQPEIRQYLFDKVKEHCLTYDPVTGKWRGADL